MADSEYKKNQLPPKNFADDLDSMLDDAASSFDNDELMNDNDALDKLLMDSAFDLQESKDEEDIDQLLSENLELDDGLKEEPNNGSVTDDLLPQSEHGQMQTAQAVGVLEDTEMAEIDEFSDFDEFSELEPVQQQKESRSSAKKNSSEPLSDLEFDNDDFTLAEFDISDSEDENDEFSENQDESKASDEKDSGFYGDDEEVEPEPNSVVYDDQTPFSEPVLSPVAQAVVDETITSQINQLFSELEILKEQVFSLNSTMDNGQSQEIARLSNVQNQFKKQLENGLKTPAITFVALGIAVVAFLTAGVFAFLNVSSNAEIESLTELVATLEENQAELNALLTKGSMSSTAESGKSTLASEEESAKIDNEVVEPLLQKSNALADKQSNETITPIAQSTSVAIKEEAEFVESAKKVEASQSSLPIETSEKSDQVAALEARIKELETKLASATESAPVKKAASKTPSPIKRSPSKTTTTAANWSVNLISFKQDWYANRKAAEFSRQGVPAKVVPVQVKGETWYRLSVTGFNNREEASAYAARVKRAHNLDSVWISKD